VRVIAATNRDLQAEVAAGRFRKDLYYRLNAVTLTLPPLWQRPADVRELARHFLRLFGERFMRPEPPLSEAEWARLAAYDWPGNVRELENYIKQRVLFGEAPALAASRPAPESTWRDLSETEKQSRIREALEATAGNVSLAAERLGISRRTIQKLRRQG
jgi:transcriptional regulator with PAS, ATPase and Fis domain